MLLILEWLGCIRCGGWNVGQSKSQPCWPWRRIRTDGHRGCGGFSLYWIHDSVHEASSRLCSAECSLNIYRAGNPLGHRPTAAGKSKGVKGKASWESTSRLRRKYGLYFGLFMLRWQRALALTQRTWERCHIVDGIVCRVHKVPALRGYSYVWLSLFFSPVYVSRCRIRESSLVLSRITFLLLREQ